MAFSSASLFEYRQLFGRNGLILLLSLIVLACQASAAPSSPFYPMGSENPVMRQYKLMSLFPPPSSYNNAGANRKMIRSSSYTARNCFFSPVQCHLSKTPLGGGDSSLRRRRRILTGTATAPSYDDYAPIARFRRDYIDYAY